MSVPKPVMDFPLPRLLRCPACGAPHVDKGLWAVMPHRTHLCSNCGREWRPFDTSTVGVTPSALAISRLMRRLEMSGRVKSKSIADECPDIGPLLVRYTLRKSPAGAIYVHHLLRSDAGRRTLHDHPWDFTSIILSGGYFEISREGRRFYRAGSVLRRRAEWQHRLELDSPAWTLVFVGGRRREWGFWGEGDRFTHVEDYDTKSELCPD